MKLTKLFIACMVVSMVSCSKPALSPDLASKLLMWEKSDFTTEEELVTLNRWVENNEFDSIKEAFGDTLKFGTAGLRALMGPGTNRMNAFTVALATQGFADYLNRTYPNSCFKVVVGYDCRHNSKEFADIVADVFSANGIYVNLFDDMRPTPEISFAIRELNCCVAGVNITASHNTKEFNGYKAYWSDGGQIVQPVDKEIIEAAQKLTVNDIKHQRVDSLVTYIGGEMDCKYALAVQSALLDKEAAKKAKALKIVYSPLHGAGVKIVPMCLRGMGVTNISFVKEQQPDNGEFASVDTTYNRQANPEDERAMQWVLAQAKEKNADLAVATDPDADRFGFYCKDSKGEWHRIDGHQSTMLFTKYIIDTRKRLGMMPEKPFMGRTIVTSEIVKRIAEEAQIKMYDEYTGFKWIANRIVSIRKYNPDSTFIGAGEESFCYLPYDKVRDKDAPASICLLAEMAASAQMRGTTLWDDLMAIYLHYGFQREYTLKWGIKENGKMWKENKETIMSLFRDNLKTINNHKFQCYDYTKQTVADLLNMPVTDNTLQYFMENGIKLTIRPSGTEPKLKVYMEIPYGDFKSADDYGQAVNFTNVIRLQIENELKEILTNNHFEIE